MQRNVLDIHFRKPFTTPDWEYNRGSGKFQLNGPAIVVDSLSQTSHFIIGWESMQKTL